jgi:hypothetical protein
VYHNLCIGLRGELPALCFQFPTKVTIVFDDPVVDDSDSTSNAKVGMGVTLARFTVSRPTGVSDADLASDGVSFDHLLQSRQFPNLSSDGDVPTALHDGQAGRVVAAILQSLQSIKNDRGRILRTHVAHDAAHVSLLLSIL